MMGGLYEATCDLHHACEAHPVGQRMTQGVVTPQEWADWLAGFRALHVAIDPWLPAHMARVALLNADLALLPKPHTGQAAQALAATLTTPLAIEAAAYVLHGAHRRGGRVLASTMGKAGLPTAHVAYPLPADVEALVKALRDRDDLADGARAVFAGLLAVMDEIEARA
jgi:threonine dehydrogenase-like Zn-dependent dehydrogenase